MRFNFESDLYVGNVSSPWCWFLIKIYQICQNYQNKRKLWSFANVCESVKNRILAMENTFLGSFEDFWSPKFFPKIAYFAQNNWICQNFRNFGQILKICSFSMSPKMCWWRLTPTILNFWPKNLHLFTTSKFHLIIASW